MQNENRLVPDFRPETTETYTEKYTPAGGTEQTATYKIGGAHPIIGGILDKFTWIRTHAAAVWWNALEGITLRTKIEQMDENIARLEGERVNYVVLNGVSLSNDPVGAIKMNWDALEKGVYVAKISCGGEYAALILKTSQTFGAAHIIGYLGSDPIFLTLHSGNWSK